MGLNEERVLHVASWVVVGKVHGTIYVPVILNLGALGQREAQA